jgi:uncharacterized protein (TIGR00369 family)
MDIHPLIRHRPDPDHPGWSTWDLEGERFHRVVGKLLVRADGPGKAVCRMFPAPEHANLGEILHGGALLTFLDMALFAGGTIAGATVSGAVTLDCNVHFIGRGRIGIPLDAHVELLRETKRLAFLQGRVVQDGELVAAFSGTLRKPSGTT